MPVARSWSTRIEGTAIKLEIVTSALNPPTVLMDIQIAGPPPLAMSPSEFEQLLVLMQDCARQLGLEPGKATPRRKK